MSLENCYSFLPDGEFQENFSLPDIDSYKRGPLVDAAAYSPRTATAIGLTVIIAAVTGGGYGSFRYAENTAVIGDTALLIGVVSGQMPIVCQEVSPGVDCRNNMPAFIEAFRQKLDEQDTPNFNPYIKREPPLGFSYSNLQDPDGSGSRYISGELNPWEIVDRFIDLTLNLPAEVGTRVGHDRVIARLRELYAQYPDASILQFMDAFVKEQVFDPAAHPEYLPEHYRPTPTPAATSETPTPTPTGTATPIPVPQPSRETGFERFSQTKSREKQVLDDALVVILAACAGSAATLIGALAVFGWKYPDKVDELLEYISSRFPSMRKFLDRPHEEDTG